MYVSAFRGFAPDVEPTPKRLVELVDMVNFIFFLAPDPKDSNYIKKLSFEILNKKF